MSDKRDEWMAEYITIGLAGGFGDRMREAAERAVAPMPSVSIAWMAFDAVGHIVSWSPPRTLRGRLRHWWRKRHGWTYYDGEGRLA